MSTIAIAPTGGLPVRRQRGTGSSASDRRVASSPQARRTARAVAAERPLRLTARGRVVVWVLALALAAGVGGAALSAQADGPTGALEVQRLAVAPGQTLWEIAVGVAEPGDDVRDVVIELMRLNGLSTGGLQAGQQIVVPVG